jgi:hypothetical protein
MYVRIKMDSDSDFDSDSEYDLEYDLEYSESLLSDDEELPESSSQLLPAEMPPSKPLPSEVIRKKKLHIRTDNYIVFCAKSGPTRRF